MAACHQSSKVLNPRARNRFVEACTMFFAYSLADFVTCLGLGVALLVNFSCAPASEAPSQSPSSWELFCSHVSIYVVSPAVVPSIAKYLSWTPCSPS